MRDIRTRQQAQLSGEYRKRRKRKGKRPVDLLRKGGKTVGRVVDFFCWVVLISFIIIAIVGALFFIGMAIYFHTELHRENYTTEYSEQQRMEDEIQIQALKEDAERREAKKREKEEKRRRRKWKRKNF